MRVKVTQASSYLYWYAKFINEEFEVSSYDGGKFQVMKGDHKNDLIDRSDCKILNETFKTFLTTKYPLYADENMHVNLTVKQLCELVEEWEKI